MQNKTFLQGHSLVELLIAIGLMALILPALLTGFFATRGGRAQYSVKQQAIHLVREAEEAVRVIRDSDWTTFASYSDGFTQYHPVVTSNSWALAASAESVQGLTRHVIISDVYRDFADPAMPIVTSTTPGSIEDPSTKKIVTTVSWSTPLPSSVVSVTYLTRNTNLTYTETTASQFQQGTYTSAIAVTNSSGGEVTLGAGSGGGDWCAPNLTINSLDLPGQGITTDISSTYLHAFTTTGGNASGNSMDSVNITNVNPPVATNAGSYNNYKTYGLYADPSNNRVYLTSDHPGLTVDIIDGITRNQISTFNNSGNERGISVFVSGTAGYVTAGSKLHSFDTTKNPAQELGTVSLAGVGKRVKIVGNYAYIATANTTKQLQIINITNPANMVSVGTVNVGNGASGVDVSVDNTGNIAFLVTPYVSASSPDFFIINLSTRTVVGSYNTHAYGQMSPKGVAYIPPGDRAIIVGSGGEQYQVLKIVNNVPSHCGGLSNPNGATSVNAVDFVSEPDGDVFSYILTNNSSMEFQMIAGGPGGVGGLYTSSGVFESRTFDAGHDSAFNTLSATTTIPGSTGLTFSLAIKSGISGSCSGVTFSDADFFPVVPGTLSFGSAGYTNPGQCLRYRANLSTSDSAVTPVLEDITFNYSP